MLLNCIVGGAGSPDEKCLLHWLGAADESVDRRKADAVDVGTAQHLGVVRVEVSPAFDDRDLDEILR